eukprot:92606-Chlamydomonas_euryale.AAC.5
MLAGHIPDGWRPRAEEGAMPAFAPQLRAVRELVGMPQARAGGRRRACSASTDAATPPIRRRYQCAVGWQRSRGPTCSGLP